MALRKIKLGDYIQLSFEKNTDELLGIDNVRGISTQKKFIQTKADMDGVSLKNYKIVKPQQFAYVPDTSRRGEKISLAFNDTEESFLVSSISLVFFVDSSEILPYYLFMYFNRPEFDRYARFNSWGSAREPFNWNEMCDIEIELPDIHVQQKYVNLYLSMLKNQDSYEKGLNDLKLVCDGYIEDLRKKIRPEKIATYIEEYDERNKFNQVKLLQGFCMTGDFIEPRRISIDIPSLKILKHGQLIYNRAVECVTDKFIVAIREGNTCAVSNSYIIFSSIDENVLMNKYLLLWLKRKEFARYSKFISHGTTHENFDFEDMKEVKIPIPKIEVQKSIVDIYECYFKRYSLLQTLKNQLKDLCPILIKGSIEEARR